MRMKKNRGRMFTLILALFLYPESGSNRYIREDTGV
jgi:hypothetical protein